MLRECECVVTVQKDGGIDGFDSLPAGAIVKDLVPNVDAGALLVFSGKLTTNGTDQPPAAETPGEPATPNCRSVASDGSANYVVGYPGPPPHETGPVQQFPCGCEYEPHIYKGKDGPYGTIRPCAEHDAFMQESAENRAAHCERLVPGIAGVHAKSAQSN